MLGGNLEEARRNRTEVATYAGDFNFGPRPEANRSVRDVVEEILKHWPGAWEQVHQEKHLKEAPLLSLAIDKVKTTLGWTPRWDFPRTIAETIAWYRANDSGTTSMLDFTRKQIDSYCSGGL